jgi:hypothetical protein
MNVDNLKPIIKGQTGENHPAKKPLDQHRNKMIAITVTQKELDTFKAAAKKSGLTASNYGRELLGIDN